MEENRIQQLKENDAIAFEKTIQDYSGYVYTIIRNFSRGGLSDEDMEELTADTFIRLWSNREQLKADAPLSPYLAAIARNCVKNRFRTMHRRCPFHQSLEDLNLSDDTDLCKEAEQTDMIAVLLDGLAQLNAVEQELIVRFYFYGEKTSEIAAALGLTDTAVRLRLHRSKGKLRKFMIERGFDHAE